MTTVEANPNPKPNDRTPFAVTECTGCVCVCHRVRCEPSPGMVFVECSKCGATQRIEHFDHATPCYRGARRKENHESHA